MISKRYRLNEKELGKVLRKKKPFFSYSLVANILPNTLEHGRCAILLSGKQAKGSVNRNFLRRFFYDISNSYLKTEPLDVVFVPKKGVVFDFKDGEKREAFARDIHFLWKLIRKIKNQ